MSTNSVSSSIIAALQNETSSASSTASSSSTGSSTTTAIDNAQNQFLKLLVTQMQNQDPMNPMDNAQVTSQMAQIATVTGVQQVNTTLGSLTSVLQAAQTTQATAMIGHTVLADGNNLALSSSGSDGAFNLASGASNVTIGIYDSTGKQVATQQLTNVAAGNNSFSWSGTETDGSSASAGNYTFKVTATNAGTAVTATPLAYGQVTSVTLNNGTPTLQVSGLGNVPLTNVSAII